MRVDSKTALAFASATSMLAMGFLALQPATVVAQDYPSKRIRVLTTSAGGGSDFTARLIAQALSSSLGWQMIIDNRAAGHASAEITARAPADGYTLAVQGTGFLTVPFLQKTDVDALKDFAPVTMIERTVNILVVYPSLAANSVPELIALAKAKPGVLNYGSSTTGSANHLAAELFKFMAGVDIVRVSYQGPAPALADVINGQVQMMFPTIVSVMPLVKAGKLRALAVTSAQPSQLAAGLLTIAASGLPGYVAIGMTGLLAPARTPQAIVDQLNREVRRVLVQSDVKERLFATGAEPVGSSPEEFTAIIKTESARMAKLVKDAGIKTN